MTPDEQDRAARRAILGPTREERDAMDDAVLAKLRPALKLLEEIPRPDLYYERAIENAIWVLKFIEKDMAPRLARRRSVNPDGSLGEP